MDVNIIYIYICEFIDFVDVTLLGSVNTDKKNTSKNNKTIISSELTVMSILWRLRKLIKTVNRLEWTSGKAILKVKLLIPHILPLLESEGRGSWYRVIILSRLTSQYLEIVTWVINWLIYDKIWQHNLNLSCHLRTNYW